MNSLDENIREDQRALLQRWAIPVHQIGVDAGRKGMQDEEIVPFFAYSPRYDILYSSFA